MAIANYITKCIITNIFELIKQVLSHGKKMDIGYLYWHNLNMENNKFYCHKCHKPF